MCRAYKATPAGRARASERQRLRDAGLRAGAVEAVEREIVLVEHDGLCGICSTPVDPSHFHIDHIVPLSRGGEHSYANTQPAHPLCNTRKYNRVPAALVAAVVALLVLAPGAWAFPNGQYPSSALSQVRHPSAKVYLAKGGAAASYNTFAICAERAGRAVYVNGPNSGYRLRFPASRYGTQEWFWRHQPPLAARPGTSNHGRGAAGDWNPAGIARLRQVGAAYRWRKTEAFGEPWHFTYVGGWARPDPGLSSRTPLLARGSGGTCLATDVREVQRRLGLKQDGEFGAGTESELKSWQRREFGKNAATGKTGPKTWARLRTTKTKAASARPITLRPRRPAIRGADVRAIQGQLTVRLRELGSSTRVQITGAYGAQSQKAMREFQTRSKLPATAAVGPATLKALRTPTRAANAITNAVDQAAPRE